MTLDEAKDILIDTCRSPLEMEVAEIGRGLERWGYRVIEWERLTDAEDREVLQQYLIWLECPYGIELARRNIVVWLEEKKEWHHPGHWSFVVRYHKPNQPLAEFSFEICQYASGFYRIRNVDANVCWPNRFNRHGIPPAEL